MTDKKIALIVDDEKDMVRVIRDRLEAIGLKVITAVNGEEAVQKAFMRPDIIILDYMMPVMNGMDALRKLKENELTSDIPVIMLTAKGDNSIQNEVTFFGAEFAEKPFHPAELAEKVRVLING